MDPKFELSGICTNIGLNAPSEPREDKINLCKKILKSKSLILCFYNGMWGMIGALNL